MLSLDKLEKDQKATHRKKRVGRGDASGMGTYSTRGLKGQRSRSGGKSGLTVRSIKSYLLRIPKSRGFQSLNEKMSVVNVGDFNGAFEDGQEITSRDILKAGLVKQIDKGVKVLSQGKLNKKLTVKAEAFSQSAKAAIEKAGGKAILVGKKEKSKVDNKKQEKSEEADKK